MTTPQLTWLITGCSSGFGLELAHELLTRKERVIATARNGPARLGDLKAQGAAVVDLDVTWPQEKVDAAIHEALAIYGGIDVLVNNAGYVELGLLEEMPLEDLQRSLDTMTLGCVKTIRAVLPHFRSKRAGYNVLISSVFAWTGMGAASAYCASKGALEGIVECLQHELQPFGITNLIFEPGWYRTRLAHPDNAKLATGSIAAYDEQRTQANAGVAAVNGNQPGDPRKAVRCIVDVVRREGVAKDKKELPLRIPMGQDCIDVVRQKCLDTLKMLDEWGPAMADTNFDS